MVRSNGVFESVANAESITSDLANAPLLVCSDNRHYEYFAPILDARELADWALGYLAPHFLQQHPAIERYGNCTILINHINARNATRWMPCARGIGRLLHRHRSQPLACVLIYRTQVTPFLMRAMVVAVQKEPSTLSLK